MTDIGAGGDLHPGRRAPAARPPGLSEREPDRHRLSGAVSRHRHRPVPWRWWPGAVLGALPQVLATAALLGAAGWAAVVRAELYVVPVALLLGVLLLAAPRTRRTGAGLLAATAVGIAVVVATAYAVSA